MPYTQVYKARYLDGSVGYLAPSSNVFVPGFSNTLMNAPTYIGGFDNNTLKTANLAFVSMNFTSPTTFRASNIALTSVITASNLYSYNNVIACANINFVNYLGTLQPFANTMTTGNLVVRDTVTATKFLGSTYLFSNIESQTNAFAATLTGAVRTYANSIFTTNVTTSTYITSGLSASNINSGNIIASSIILTGVEGSNTVQTTGTLSCTTLVGKLTGNLIGTTYAANTVGNYLPWANSLSAVNVTAQFFVGGTLTAGTNLIQSTTITGGNIVGLVNAFSNTVTTTSTLRASTFIGGFVTSGNITTTGTVTGTKIIGGILGANTLSTESTMTTGPLTGAIRSFANGITCQSTVTGQQFVGALNTYANNISVTNTWASSITALSLLGDRVGAANIATSNIIGPIVAYANTIQTLANAYGQNFIGDISLGSGPLTTQNPLTASNIIGSITAYSNNISIDQALYSGILTGAIIGSNNIQTTGLIRAGSLYGGITSTDYVRTNSNMSGSQLIGGIAGSNTITVSNAVFTQSANFQGNIVSTNVITSTLVVGSLAGNIRSYQNNISTTSFIVASNISGQILCYANTINTQTNISYGTDLSRSGIFYRAGASNVIYITQSLTHNLSNSYGRQLAWSTSSNNSSVSYYSTGSLTGWYGSVLLPDGRVCFVPDTATSVGFFNPQTNTFSNIVPGGDGISTLGGGWRGGVLMPDSNVVFLPYSNAFLVMYDPVTNILRKRQSPSAGTYLGGCLLPNGNVICVPNSVSSVLHEINPYNPVGTETKFLGVGTGSFAGCILRPDGKVILVPQSDVFGYVYDYSTDIFSSLTSIPGLLTGPTYYSGGVWLPTGRAFLISNVAIYSTYVTGTTPTPGPIIPASTWGCVTGNGKVVMATPGASITVFDAFTELYYSVLCDAGYTAPVATPCGRVVFSPQTATGGVMVLNLHGQVPQSVLLSPYLNKL
ncbi:hypothetical protein EBT25_00780 [bacterium]|nr:hypothetical protein [bacterium]